MSEFESLPQLLRRHQPFAETLTVRESFALLLLFVADVLEEFSARVCLKIQFVVAVIER